MALLNIQNFIYQLPKINDSNIIPQSIVGGGEMHCLKIMDHCESQSCKPDIDTQKDHNLCNALSLLHSDTWCTSVPYTQWKYNDYYAFYKAHIGMHCVSTAVHSSESRMAFQPSAAFCFLFS